jgi:hypothetical protein
VSVRILLVSMLLGSALSMVGCPAVQTIPDRDQRALLILDVEPESTEIYIDSEYRGVVEGWTGQAVPIEPGYHRVELRARGKITRRFDVEARAGEQIELRVKMEPTLDE